MAAKYGKSKKVTCERAYAYAHHQEALKESGYEYRFTLKQANGKEREVYADEVGQTFALFGIDRQAPGKMVFDLREYRNE